MRDGIRTGQWCEFEHTSVDKHQTGICQLALLDPECMIELVAAILAGYLVLLGLGAALSRRSDFGTFQEVILLRPATRACRSNPDRTMSPMRNLAAGRLSTSSRHYVGQSNYAQVRTEGVLYRTACHQENGSKLDGCVDLRKGPTWEIHSTMVSNFLSGASLCWKACGPAPRRSSMNTHTIWDR